MRGILFCIIFLAVVFGFFFAGEAKAATEILRPNGPGSETGFSGQSPDSGEHWQKVTEISPDDGNSYIYHFGGGSNYARDLYNLSDSSVGIGTINKVTISIRFLVSGSKQYRPTLRTHGVTYDGSEVKGSGSGWYTYSQEWTQNPQTGLSWTWDEINSLEIGVSGRYIPQVTQVYAEVDYTLPPPCQSHNVSGWAWSNMDNPATPADERSIGWVSFSCKNTMVAGSGVDYGIDIASSNGYFWGYAWSENIGWIKFAPIGPYPSAPSYPTCLDFSGPGQPCDGTGDYTVSGWARACSVFQTGCSGALRPDSERGGWDGWIKLRGTAADGSPYGVSIDQTTGDFSGYGWSDMAIGWISFKGANYKVQSSPFSHTLTVAVFGSGIVTTTPAAGINCGSGRLDCSESYLSGTSVSLTAIPASDWLTHWSGSCSVEAGNTCIITMDADKRVTVVFSPNQPPDKPVGDGEVWNHCIFQGKSIPTFEWETYSDPDDIPPGTDPQTAYQIRISDNASFPQEPGSDEFTELVEGSGNSYNPSHRAEEWAEWMDWNNSYHWIVRVRDSHNNWSKWSNPDEFKTPKHAYPYPGFTWLPEEANQGEVVVFDPEETNVDYLWTFNGGSVTTYETADGKSETSEDPHIKFLIATNKVKLKVTDSDKYSCESQERDILVQLPLPEYKEVPPISWLKEILAGLYNFVFF